LLLKNNDSGSEGRISWDQTSTFSGGRIFNLISQIQHWKNEFWSHEIQPYDHFPK
jgi:hypothetical protein